MPQPQLVFVYGLLMKDQPLHHHMSGGTFVSEGSVHGKLWSFGRYPGLTDGSGTVRGELYRFDDLAAALDVLDDVEEFDPTDPAGSLYLRSARRVRTSSGDEVDAWVYTYNQETSGARAIASGDWRSAPSDS